VYNPEHTDSSEKKKQHEIRGTGFEYNKCYDKVKSNMLDALIKGKLSREVEGMEDILTSNVFDAFKYSSKLDSLWSFLKLAVNENGVFLKDMMQPPNKVDYEFWPWWDSPRFGVACEPDLVLTFTHADKSKSLVLIEAKFRSGKSGVDEDNTNTADNINGSTTKDKLAREWLALLDRVNKGHFKNFAVIYLTAHFVIPLIDIKESFNSIQINDKTPRDVDPSSYVFWLSWRHLAKAIEGDSDSIILSDLRRAITERMGLIFYNGLSLGEQLVCPWSYSSRIISEHQEPTLVPTFNWIIKHRTSGMWRYLP